jgi:1-phosphofructokinase
LAVAATVITVTMNTAIDRVLKAPGFEVGAHINAQQMSHTPAGKGVNLARALARLGRSNIATGFVGHSEAESFESFLNAGEGLGRVNNQLLSVRGPTRENITVLDPDAGTDTHLRTTGYQLTEHDLARLTTKVGLLSREDVVFVFAGSLPDGMDDAALACLIATAQSGGAKVVLDLDGKTLGAALNTLGQAVWMISPNRLEFADALGHDVDMGFEPLLQAVRLASAKAGWILVSLGRDGGLLVTDSGAYRGICEVDPARVVSTVGSGDCLVASVIDAHLSGRKPGEALKQGLAVATASTFHANPSDFDRADIKDLAASIRIQEV